MQERFYDDQIDYRRGSPHLAHWSLFDRLTGVVRDALTSLTDAGLPLTVLEVGAGHGGYTEPVLAAGASVTAVEMSESSVWTLERRFGTNSAFSAIYEPDGSLDGVAGEFSLVLCVSVLHHIPDYLTSLSEMASRVAPGGALLTLQDPVSYSRHAKAHTLDRVGYLLWRLGQGDLRAGAGSRIRRIRGVIDESNPRDMVEYHVVRDGVDEIAVFAALKPLFASVEPIMYWSNQLSIAQKFGDSLGLTSTFGVLATGRLS
jgi:SAM-dependent methyltransferase